MFWKKSFMRTNATFICKRNTVKKIVKYYQIYQQLLF